MTDVKETAKMAVEKLMTPEEKGCAAESVIRHYAMWSMGVGLVPVAFLDFAALGVVQYNLCGKLCGIYGVPVASDRIRAIVATLVSAVLPNFVARSLVKLLPFVGPSLGAASLPLLCGASTLALGKVFTRHLAEGGTLLDFEPAKFKTCFVEHFESAKKVIPSMQKESARATA